MIALTVKTYSITLLSNVGDLTREGHSPIASKVSLIKLVTYRRRCKHWIVPSCAQKALAFCARVTRSDAPLITQYYKCACASNQDSSAKVESKHEWKRPSDMGSACNRSKSHAVLKGPCEARPCISSNLFLRLGKASRRDLLDRVSMKSPLILAVWRALSSL